jgi:hypothetical protein
MSIDPLERFDTVVNFAVSDPTMQAEVKKAGRRLLEDAALEVGESSSTAIGLLLLQIYKQGYVPGKSSNDVINEISEIVAKAGRDNAAATTHDTY